MTRSQVPSAQRLAHRLGRLHALEGQVNSGAPQSPYRELGVVGRIFDDQDAPRFAHLLLQRAQTGSSLRTSQYSPS